MDWIEVPGKTGQFATLVRYSCTNISWGYPSTGLNQTWAMCNDLGEWNITNVENCTGNTRKCIGRESNITPRFTLISNSL